MDDRVRSFWLAVLVAVLAGTGVSSGSMIFAAAIVGFIGYREGWLCGLFVGMVAVATNPSTQALIQSSGQLPNLVRYGTTYNSFSHLITYAHLLLLIPTTAIGGHCGATFRKRVWDPSVPRAWREG